MQIQMKMLACGNHDNFTKNLQVPHLEVNNKTLGVIGAGHIGKKVIQIAKALDMNILVHSRTPKEDEEKINEDVANDDGKIEDETEEQENKEKLPNEETESLNDDETQNVSEESKEKENNDEEN